MTDNQKGKTTNVSDSLSNRSLIVSTILVLYLFNQSTCLLDMMHHWSRYFHIFLNVLICLIRSSIKSRGNVEHNLPLPDLKPETKVYHSQNKTCVLFKHHGDETWEMNSIELFCNWLLLTCTCKHNHGKQQREKEIYMVYCLIYSQLKRELQVSMGFYLAQVQVQVK